MRSGSFSFVGRAPVYETFVRLSRDGITATIPMETLVSDPAENIYAYPGDVLTLVRLPVTASLPLIAVILRMSTRIDA